MSRPRRSLSGFVQFVRLLKLRAFAHDVTRRMRVRGHAARAENEHVRESRSYMRTTQHALACLRIYV